MGPMSSSSASRRAVVYAAASLAIAPVLAPVAEAAPLHKVAILGDSITTGWGLPAPDALPARLQGELARLGAPARIMPSGVIGDTTAGGLARVDSAAPAGTDLCVVALGGNDLLQGADPTAVKTNLDKIIHRLKGRGVTVVLAGLKLPAVLDGPYATAFDAAFISVARADGVLYVPNMLEGVMLNPALNQSDGVHPNAAGVELIARRLAPVVARGLSAR
ncbi:MAG: tesA [Phenylobacterium sp.]|nr:tesA [Phenylobacterium sp.]